MEVTQINELVITVGLPYSGKSTWAKSMKVPIVCPDAIRLAMYGKQYWAPGEKAVWATAYYMIRSLFLAEHRIVILDACNVSAKRRADWICKDNDVVWITHAKLIDTETEECIRRAIDAERPDMTAIIERMAGNWEYPTIGEGLTSMI